MATYTTKCSCGRMTSKSYARKNGGKCKACVHPELAASIREQDAENQRNSRILESGYEAYAREEDHYGYSDR